jgi:peroxiredoxin family protein
VAEPVPGLALVIHSGEAARVHYALVLAAAAAAIGRPVILFFAGSSLALARDAPGDLAGHATFSATARATGAPDIETLWRACRELGVRLIACETAMRLAGAKRSTLAADVEVAGAVTLLGAARGHDLLFV